MSSMLIKTVLLLAITAEPGMIKGYAIHVIMDIASLMEHAIKIAPNNSTRMFKVILFAQIGKRVFVKLVLTDHSSVKMVFALK